MSFPYRGDQCRQSWQAEPFGGRERLGAEALALCVLDGGKLGTEPGEARAEKVVRSWQETRA